MKHTKINKEKLKIDKMASGNLCLFLTDKIEWSQFNKFAQNFIDSLNGKINSKSESASTIIWDIRIDDNDLLLVYDDFPYGITLESKNKNSDILINKIYKILTND